MNSAISRSSCYKINQKRSSLKVQDNDHFKAKKSSPLFYGLNKQKRISRFESYGKDRNQGSQEKSQKRENDMVRTKNTLKQSYQNSLNQTLNGSSSRTIKQDNLYEEKQNKFNTIKSEQKENQYFFGNGLQQIEFNGQKDDFNKKYSQITAGCDKRTRQNRISFKKTIDSDCRSTGHRFFKRALSSHSQEYLKSGIKSEKRDLLNIRESSINSSKARQPRGSVFLKTQPISRQRHRESFVTYNKQYVNNLYNQNLQYEKKNNKNDQHYLSFANNIDKLVFKYNGGHASTLFNYRLKIKNQFHGNIGVKIKCTNPRHYQVSPCYQTVLEPLQILSLSIQLKLNPHDLDQKTMKHDLIRYRGDKFMIFYWTSQMNNDSNYFEGERILPVVIEQTEEQKLRNQGFAKGMSEERSRKTSEEKQIEMYKKYVENNNLRMGEMDEKIKKIQSIESKLQYFNTPLFTIIAILGLLIGLWFG